MTGKVHSYEGESIVVEYDARRCIHAGECVRGLPGVFDPKGRPWVRPDAAAADEVAAVVCRCPTGALRFSRRDGGAPEAPAQRATITVDADGPLYVRGDVEVVGTDREVMLREPRVAFCRCGASKVKPFCDGCHSEAGFRDAGRIPDPRVKGEAEPAGKLTVVLAKDGPLILKGPFALQSSAGEDRCEGAGGALCRCGASKNHPFCDGNHKDAGFSDG